jgi:hypothetical protein
LRSKPFVVAHRAVRSSPWPRPPRLVCPSVSALRFMNDQEYLRLTSPSLAPSASFDPSALEAQFKRLLSIITSGSARCSESVSESRAVTAAGSPASISVSAVPTLDSTVSEGGDKEEGFVLFDPSGALADTVPRSEPGIASWILRPVRTSSLSCSEQQRSISGRGRGRCASPHCRCTWTVHGSTAGSSRRFNL